MCEIAMCKKGRIRKFRITNNTIGGLLELDKKVTTDPFYGHDSEILQMVRR